MKKTAAAKRRYRAIRKAVLTRQANRAARERWDNVDGPAQQRFTELVNVLIKSRQPPILLKFTPRDTGLTLRKGSGLGMLVGVKSGGWTYVVKVDSYKTPREFHRAFWEPLI